MSRKTSQNKGACAIFCYLLLSSACLQCKCSSGLGMVGNDVPQCCPVICLSLCLSHMPLPKPKAACGITLKSVHQQSVPLCEMVCLGLVFLFWQNHHPSRTESMFLRLLLFLLPTLKCTLTVESFVSFQFCSPCFITVNSPTTPQLTPLASRRSQCPIKFSSSFRVGDLKPQPSIHHPSFMIRDDSG